MSNHIVGHWFGFDISTHTKKNTHHEVWSRVRLGWSFLQSSIQTYIDCPLPKGNTDNHKTYTNALFCLLALERNPHLPHATVG